MDDDNNFVGVKGLHIIHLNIRSIINKIDIFRHYLNNSNISIATISETWLHEFADSFMISVDGYQLFRQDRTTVNANNRRKTGGGLCTFIKNGIRVDAETLENMNQCDSNIEIQWIICNFEYSKNIIIGNVYRPPRETPMNSLIY